MSKFKKALQVLGGATASCLVSLGVAFANVSLFYRPYGCGVPNEAGGMVCAPGLGRIFSVVHQGLLVSLILFFVISLLIFILRRKYFYWGLGILLGSLLPVLCLIYIEYGYFGTLSF